MRLLQDLYSDCQLWLEIEEPDETALNNQERIRRKNFYLRNGMKETGIRIRLFGVSMEILSTDSSMTYAQCEKLYRELYGPMYQKVIQLVEEK